MGVPVAIGIGALAAWLFDSGCNAKRNCEKEGHRWTGGCIYNNATDNCKCSGEYIPMVTPKLWMSFIPGWLNQFAKFSERNP